MNYALHSLAMALGFVGLVFVLILLHGVLHAAKDDVDLADPRTIAGVLALEQVGLIAQGRAAEILA